MRLALSSCSIVLGLVALALPACGDDGSGGSGAFSSPYGDPGGSVVCGPSTYLSGWTCLPRLDGSVIDAGAPRDAALDGAAPEVASPNSGDASRATGSLLP